jgi:hypothetical protein
MVFQIVDRDLPREVKFSINIYTQYEVKLSLCLTN